MRVTMFTLTCNCKSFRSPLYMLYTSVKFSNNFGEKLDLRGKNMFEISTTRGCSIIIGTTGQAAFSKQTTICYHGRNSDRGLTIAVAKLQACSPICLVVCQEHQYRCRTFDRINIGVAPMLRTVRAKQADHSFGIKEIALREPLLRCFNSFKIQ